jgi:hypothetical protein
VSHFLPEEIARKKREICGEAEGKEVEEKEGKIRAFEKHRGRWNGRKEGNTERRWQRGNRGRKRENEGIICGTLPVSCHLTANCSFARGLVATSSIEL